MSRKSVKENKNCYQTAREECGLTRLQASELMDYISESRIEKIESERIITNPDDVLAMAKAYKKPALCNYYCSHECHIGQEYVPEIRVKDLAQIVLNMLATLNSLDKAKGRLIEITADGEISDDELTDFAKIEAGIAEISMSADLLSLWLNNMIASGKIEVKSIFVCKLPLGSFESGGLKEGGLILCYQVKGVPYV